MAKKVVCFGEVLLRLAAPDGEQLLQTGKLNVHVGGAEANVAVSLAQFGHHSVMATVLPDNVLAAPPWQRCANTMSTRARLSERPAVWACIL